MPKKSRTEINRNEVSEQFSKVKHKYDTLGTNLAQALKLFLDEKDLKVLSVEFRTKDKDSFVEKIDRKNYENPFDEIEDICGIRIICYYQSDVDKIAQIIKQEFEVLQNEDKEQLLEADQFGYRSTHFIVKIKKEWLKAPNYRNLENLKAEIQIRTVLMHAWAEIEHKLAYKKASHIRKEFRRKLSRISAKLEEADEQFEELRKSVASYKEDIVETVQSKTEDAKNIELNLDSLQAFFDANFPERKKNILETRSLVDEFLEHNINLKDLIRSYDRAKNYLSKIETEAFPNMPKYQWNQSSLARVVMYLDNDEFLYTDTSTSFHALIIKWREIIHENESQKP